VCLMGMFRSAAWACLFVDSLGAASDVVFQDVSMSGMLCGRYRPFVNQQDGLVVYPKKEGKHPLVAYAHGWTDGGSHLDAADLHDLFTLLASSGYVVVAQKAPYNLTDLGDWCEYEWEDQLQSLRWAKNASILHDHIDLAGPTVVAGHSMGALATLHTLSQAKAVKEFNIVAAAVQHPASCWHQIYCDYGSSLVPTLFSVGEKDALARHVRYEYNRTTGVPKAFAEMTGVGHTDPATAHWPESNNWAGPPRVENHYVLDWLNCFVKHNATACALAQCGEPQASSPTTTCVFEGMPSANTVAIV